jgi:hypothetical protein
VGSSPLLIIKEIQKLVEIVAGMKYLSIYQRGHNFIPKCETSIEVRQYRNEVRVKFSLQVPTEKSAFREI